MRIIILLALALLNLTMVGQNRYTVRIKSGEVHQTIHSFGASDCWRTQYVGKNWPEEKRDSIADYLFSTDFDAQGNPRGIGLSLWRFNIGVGTHEIGDAGGVTSLWRRTECFLDSTGGWDWTKQAGQRWFLDAAKKRGVPYSLGFSIAAPVFMSKNGMGRASEETPYANLREDMYVDYAHYMAVVCEKLGIDYLSPINEPQWNWTRPGQEGMQMTNEECSRLIHCLDAELSKINRPVEVVFGEAGCINYLYAPVADNPLRSNQINEIFSPQGKYSISGLKNVSKRVSGHSYWSTWPVDSLVDWRKRLHSTMAGKLPGYSYWQTEYCPMERNDDNPDGGGKRDLGMNTALYVARVIHADLVHANAESWQYWTSITEWDYKDGLIYIDDGIKDNGATKFGEPMTETCKYNGRFRTSKLMWALGNFSRFVRPGMQRITASIDGIDDYQAMRSLMVSAYICPKTGTKVIVLINFSVDDKAVDLDIDGMNNKLKFRRYITSADTNLAFEGMVDGKISIPARSLVTLVTE
ncbi:MAG: glycoside hydrolase [Muribaculaceae bacterium]